MRIVRSCLLFVVVSVVLLGVSATAGTPNHWGVRGDLPLMIDYNRDGKCDRLVFRPSNRTWYVDYFDGYYDKVTDDTFGPWGVRGDLPIAGDFDRDGKIDDVAVFRPSTHTWYYDYDHDGTTNYQNNLLGSRGDLPVAGDFDRDGQYDDVAVFSPSTKTWFFDYNHDGRREIGGVAVPGWDDYIACPWAQPGDKPFAGNFDRDNFFDDVGLYRQSDITARIDYDHDGSVDATATVGFTDATRFPDQFPVISWKLPDSVTTRPRSTIWVFSNGQWTDRGGLY